MPKNKQQKVPVYRPFMYQGYVARRLPIKHQSVEEPKKHHYGRLFIFLAILFVGWLFLFSPFSSRTIKSQISVKSINHCASNNLNNYVLVSISQRHMWACSGSVQSYDAPAVTGMEMYAADLTPPGTYKIYAKYTHQDLKGCDQTGCWDDNVGYWMPFLYNKYGTYGFHDATWRKAGDFGNINPNSKQASHGCVELPLAAAKWLYGWAPVGTTVTIKS